MIPHVKGEAQYLHEKVGKETIIDGRGSQWRGQMLQAGGLEPPGRDRIAGTVCGSRIVQSPSAGGVVIQSSRRGGIALLHLATHVALRPSLRSQFSRSNFQQPLQTENGGNI